MNRKLQTPIQITVDASLQTFNIPLARYLEIHPEYDRLVVSAFVFNAPREETLKSSQQRRLLIVQRAPHECAYANLWEIPGGSSDSSDPTIIHSLAREVFEETGLRMKRVIRQVGDVLEFRTGWGSGQKSWAKLSFEITVAEIEDRCSLSPRNESWNPEAASHGQDDELAARAKDPEQEPLVTIDPEEHQKFAWATLADLQLGKFPIITPELQNNIFDAF